MRWLGFTAALAVAVSGRPSVAQAQRACRVAEVTVSPPDAQIQVGSEQPFLATAYDAAGQPCDNVNIRWISSDNNVVTISTAGIALGVSPGRATITARVGTGTTARSATAVANISAPGVSAANSPTIPGYRPRTNRPLSAGWAAADRQPDGTGPADNLVVEPRELMLVRGESQYLTFRAIRADGSVAAPVPIVFTVDPGGENVLLVDSLGLVGSRSVAGTATVRLTIPNNPRIQPKLVRVEVRGDTIRFNRLNVSLEPGVTDTLSVFVPQQSRSLDPSGMYTFTSSDTSKVKVNLAQPVIQALAPGMARITGASGGLLPDIVSTIYVHRRVARVELEPADTMRTIAIGGSTQVRALALDAPGRRIPEAPLLWRNTDTAVASFDTATGLVRGRRAGLAQFTVFAPGGRDSAITRNVHIRVVAGGLALPRTRLGLAVGERSPLDVQLLDDQRRPLMSAMQYLGWTSSADSVARVEGSEIFALQPGRARITGRSSWDSTVALDVYVGGEMVVVAQRAGRHDLAMYWANGSNWRPLTQDSLLEAQPAWSQDLTKLAYVAVQPAPPNSRAPSRTALWSMNVDGSEATRLTDDSAQIRSPAWAGNRIVYESNKSGMPEIWLWEPAATGTGPGSTRMVTVAQTTPNQAPTVSPDGSRMAYVSSRQTSPGRSVYGLYTAAVDGTDERLVVTAPQGQRLDEPSFAPDGRTLLFLRSESGRQQLQRVYRAPLAPAPGDTAVPVTPPTLYVRGFSVSADGSVLALNTLEQAPNNRQISRLVLFTVASGAATALGAPEDELSGAALRPAARAAAPASPAGR